MKNYNYSCLFFKAHYILYFLISFIYSQEEDSGFINKGDWWLESKIGFTFYNEDAAALDLNLTAGQPIENSIKLQFTPGLSYAVSDRLLAGAHVGFGFFNYKYSNLNHNGRIQNYKSGIHLRYYFLKIMPEFYLFAETGSNFNYLVANVTPNNNYLKSYMDTGFSFKISDEWILSFVLKDVIYYYSSTPNFENRNSNFGSSSVLKEMIRFPFFSIMYQLN